METDKPIVTVLNEDEVVVMDCSPDEETNGWICRIPTDVPVIPGQTVIKVNALEANRVDVLWWE